MSITRDTLRSMLRRALDDGVITPDRAEAILTAWDAGAIDGEDVARELDGRDPHDAASLVVPILATAALLYLASLPSTWNWDASTACYVSPKGVVLDPAIVRRDIDRVLTRAGGNAPVLPRPAPVLEPVTPGGGPVAPAPAMPTDPARRALVEWRTAIEEDLAGLHHAAAAVARGGLAQMTEADRALVRERILTEYGFLDGFAHEIDVALAVGAPMSEREINARVAQYYEAPRATFEAFNRQVQGEAGCTLEINCLGVAEHCQECPELSAQGWVPIGTLPEPGSRECLRRCRCRLEYRRAA